MGIQGRSLSVICHVLGINAGGQVGLVLKKTAGVRLDLTGLVLAHEVLP
jgi:hypothetical protein